MVQVIVFLIAFGVMVANGVGVIAAFLGAIAISFVLGLIVVGIIARKG